LPGTEWEGKGQRQRGKKEGATATPRVVGPGRDVGSRGTIKRTSMSRGVGGRVGGGEEGGGGPRLEEKLSNPSGRQNQSNNSQQEEKTLKGIGHAKCAETKPLGATV